MRTRLRALAWEGGGKGKKGERRRGQEGEGEERAFVLASHPPPQSPRATISYANSNPSPSLSLPPLLGPAPSLWVSKHTQVTHTHRVGLPPLCDSHTHTHTHGGGGGGGAVLCFVSAVTDTLTHAHVRMHAAGSFEALPIQKRNMPLTPALYSLGLRPLVFRN